MTTVTIQELIQCRDLINSKAGQKASLTLYFPSALNVGAKMRNLSPVSIFKKSLLICFKIQFLIYITP